MAEKKNKSLKKILFGSIRKKMIFSFLFIILLNLILGFFLVTEVNKIRVPLEKELPENINSVNEANYLNSLAKFIRYYDEVLTQSARNFAFTGDKKWEARYRENEPKLDNIIKEAIEKGDALDSDFFSKVDTANIVLVEMEYNAIQLVNEGNKEKAIEILESQEYWTQKAIYENTLINYVERRGLKYDEALTESTESLQEIAKKADNIFQKIYLLIILIILIISLTAFILGFFITKNISNPIKKLYNATEEVRKGNLNTKVHIKTNDELEELGDAFNKTTEILAQTDEQRKQIDSTKTKFISITSHELRSPMTPMRAQLQMLIKEQFGKLNSKQKEAVEIILRNTERLDKIICDFLEISRIEAARLKFNFVKTDLSSHIKKVIEEMKHSMPEKNIQITANIQKLPIIECDPERIMQVLRNLLENAIKFSKDKGKIEVNAKKENNFILFSVKDNGIGISKEAQPRIFEPFFQAEGTIYRKYGGTGLGLAICKGIVETQNGKIWFKSEKDKGTEFFFTIPLIPVKEIKAIKLMFSSQESADKKVEEIFKELLGPIGKREFDDIKNQGIVEENILKYIDLLAKQGIIEAKTGTEFKKKIKKEFESR